jgi:hypothetical protein
MKYLLSLIVAGVLIMGIFIGCEVKEKMSVIDSINNRLNKQEQIISKQRAELNTYKKTKNKTANLYTQYLLPSLLSIIIVFFLKTVATKLTKLFNRG